MGLPPGSLEKAQLEHKAKQRDLKSKNKPTSSFDMNACLKTARRKAVRSKPYEIHEAAKQCMELALKAGWIGMRLDEIAKQDLRAALLTEFGN